MLSVPLIQRYFERDRHDQLLEALAANGMGLPLPLRVRLSRKPGMAAAAVALGLRRLVELTYGPTSLSRAMTSWLLDHQGPEGGFAADPLAIAAAAAALGRVMRDQPQVATPQLRNAHEHAIALLATCQGDDGLFAGSEDHDARQRALITAFILYLLAEDDLFRSSVRYADAMSYFEDDEHHLDRATADMWDLVCITTCGHPTTTLPSHCAGPAAAVAAIAA